EKGSGAYLGDKKMQTAPAAAKNELLGHINPGFFPKEYRASIKEARSEFRECVSLGCAAHEYLRIACGQAHFALYSRLKPWDHLPGTLIVQEAGGFVFMWDKGVYRPSNFDVGLIVANDEATWANVYDSFLKE